jgi:hypothetical protein
MIKLARRTLTAAVVSSALFWGVLNSQDRENVYGVYRSVVNSSRAGIILYNAVQDYDQSLSHLEYNSE